MNLRATESNDGECVKCPDGQVGLDLEPVKSEAEIHIGDIDESVANGKCPVTGNSYKHKELIKKLPYGSEGTEWTGDVWAVNPRETSTLVAVLVMNEVGVTIDSQCLKYDEDWGELRREIVMDNQGGEKLRVMYPPHGPENLASESWVQDAVSMMDRWDREEFLSRFDLTVVEDEELAERLGIDEDDERVTKVRTDDPFSTE